MKHRLLSRLDEMIRCNRYSINEVSGKACFMAVVCVCLSGLSAPADQPTSLGLLRLAGGDYLSGKLADSKTDEGDTSQRLAWQHPDFAAPFDFDLPSVIGASFPPPEGSSRAKGDFAIELARGDRIFGAVIGIDDETVRVATEPFGEVLLERSAVRRISRWNDGEAVRFAGPGAVADWNVLPDQPAWLSGGSQLHTTQHGATAFRDIGLPDAMQIEVELSWEGEPNFVLAIGVDAKNSDYGAGSAFHIEVWGDEIALMRELDQTADCVSLGKWKDLNGCLRLTLELDQVAGHMVALTPQAEVLGEITVSGNGFPGVRPGVRLTNIAGNISLESLRVMGLTRRANREAVNDQDSFLMEDQTVQNGQWTGVVDGQWVLTNGDSQSRIAPEHVRLMEMQSTRSDADQSGADTIGSDKEKPDAPEDKSSAMAQVITHGGVRLRGEIQSTLGGRLTLVSEVIGEPIEFSNADISRIAVANPQPAVPESSAFILGRLQFADGRLTGRMVDTEGELQPTPLRFAPRHAAAVHLRPSFSGRMVYRESPPPETAKQRRDREQRQAVMDRRPGNGVWNALARAFGNNPSNKRVDPSPRSMHLRSGEIIPCEVTSIDEKEVVFTSEVTKRTRLPQDQIRAIAFVAGSRDPEIEAARRDRLLTVPRVRKKNPPTHLIVAVNGDVMRGRLVGVGDDTVEVETRLETIPIKRSVVAQIIWLDDRSADESDETEDDSAAESGAGDLAVRAILRNGNRMSLLVGSLDQSVLAGEHPLLGQSQIKLGDVNELLIGIDINVAGQGQPYGGWQLTDAPEPMIAEEGAQGGIAAMSPLVGTEAPDFSLALLAGGTFSTTASRGKVVVLDFWATWCGPCMQAMPVIDETVGQFDANDVRLVAVNLQETAEPIRETLDRLGISPEVALDIDGVAAGRYQADAIPQTVVIDREGTITHVFVGGGPKLGQQLHAAIGETLGEKPEAATTP